MWITGESDAPARHDRGMSSVRFLPPGTVFRVADAAGLGITAGQTRQRHLQRPFRGIRGVDVPLETALDRCRAYLPALSESSVFSHATAAEIYELPLPMRLRNELIHITSTRPTRPRTTGVRGHREVNLRTVEWGDIRLAAPADVWCQLSTELTLVELVALGDAVVSPRRWNGRKYPALCDIDDLRRAVERRSPARGTARLRDALPRVRAGVESAKETELRLLLVDAGFAEPAVAVPILDRRGQPVLVDGRGMHADLGYPTLQIALEYEGDHHRTDRGQWRKDLARVRAMQGAGWFVLRVTERDLQSPQQLIKDLRAAFDGRSSP